MHEVSSVAQSGTGFQVGFVNLLWFLCRRNFLEACMKISFRMAFLFSEICINLVEIETVQKFRVSKSFPFST